MGVQDRPVRWCANLDPSRADALRNPALRLYAEYIWEYVSAIHGAPLSAADKRTCYRHLARWLSTRLNGRPGRRVRAAIRRRARFLTRGGHTRTGRGSRCEPLPAPGAGAGPPRGTVRQPGLGNIGNDASHGGHAEVPRSSTSLPALLAACCALAFRPAGFTSRDLRHYLAPLLGKTPEDMTGGQISYDLPRLRAHQIVERIPHSRSYQVTAGGLTIALFLTG